MVASEELRIEVIFRILQAIEDIGSIDLDHSIDRIINQLLRLDQECVIAEAERDATQLPHAIFDIWSIASLMHFAISILQDRPFLD